MPLLNRLLIKPTLFVALLLLSLNLSANPLQPVSIQLKWHHSFQFAGYYAAIEQGYYQQAGLDVSLKPVDFSMNIVDQVLQGKSDYGVFDGGLLNDYLNKKPVVLVKQIFQHNPLVFLSKRNSNMTKPSDMVGKSIAYNASNPSQLALSLLLKETLSPTQKFNIIETTKNTQQDFIDGKIDVIAAYLHSQPYQFKQLGIEVNIIKPQHYGIDVYGDNFFTSQAEAINNPNRVAKMAEATLKGWHYALAHPKKISQLIHTQYNPSLSISQLEYEARVIREMIVPKLIEVGSVSAKRYQTLANDYKQLGLTTTSKVNDDFYFDSDIYQRAKLSPDEIAWKKQHPVINVGGGPDWAPFDFVNLDGKHVGLADDYLALIAQKTGLKFNIAVNNWETNYSLIKNKKTDVLAAVYYSQQREDEMNFSSPYYEIVDYFFARDDLNLNEWRDLQGKRVAIPEKFAQNAIIKKHYPQLIIVPVANFNAAIDAVLEGKADLLYDAYVSITHKLNSEGIQSIVPFKSTRHLGNNLLHIASRKDEPLLASILQKGLDAISSAEKQAIYNKWIGIAAKKNTSNKAVLNDVEKNWLKQHSSISVGGLADLIPFNFVNKTGDYSGITKDYLDLITLKTGLNFSIQIKQWAQLLNDLKTKKLDVVGGAFFTQERSEYALYSNPYYEVLDYFYIRDDVKANTLLDLNGLRVAMPKGYAHAEIIKEYFPKINIVTVDSFGDAIDAVLERRAELLFNVFSTIKYTLKNEGINAIVPFKSVRKKHGTNEFHFISRNDEPILASIINKGLAAISDAEKQRIIDKWLGAHGNQPQASTFPISPSEQQWLEQHKNIRFLGKNNALPFEAFNEQGQYQGITAGYLALIEKKLGLNITKTASNHKRDSELKMRSDEIDIMSTTADSPTNENFIKTQAYTTSTLVIVMKDSDHYVDDISQIQHKKIALLTHEPYSFNIKKQYPDIQFIAIKKLADAFTAVSTGEIDALFITLAQASYYLPNLGLSNLRIVGKTELSSQRVFAIRKDYAALAPLFNRAIESINQKEKQRISDQWGESYYSVEVDYAPIIKMLVGLTLVILIFIYWNRKLAREVELRKSIEQQTLSLIENIPLQIVITNIQGQILLANPQALNDYNIKKEDASKLNMSTFYAHAKDRLNIIDELSKKGQIDQKVITFKRTDGTLRSMMLSIMPIIYDHDRAFLSIAVDMTERIEIEQALKKSKIAAEEANQAKSMFLANVSHEIRTPMNAIIGFSELLNERVNEPSLKKFTKIIQTAGNNLLALINDILDLSKIEAGKLNIKKAACEPRALCAEMGRFFMIKMQEHNIVFNIEVDTSVPNSLMLDSARLRQVLYNLLGNAVKFTHDGSIKINMNAEKTTSKSARLFIDIEDTGIGIPAEHLESIFLAFEQSTATNAEQFGGTGLGLSISKRLVEMMGGTLSAQSVLGKGSKFSILLNDVDINFKEQPLIETEALSWAHYNFHPATLLIADDVANNREFIAERLAKFSALTILHAKNGEEAVALTQKNKLDLIFMDLRMPIMNGVQATQRIRQFSNVPIIALTASLTANDDNNLTQKGFNDFILKPIGHKTLLTLLSQYLNFDHQKTAPLNVNAIQISDAEKIYLETAIEQLKPLLTLNSNAIESNNFEIIGEFSSALTMLSEQFPITAINDVSQQLRGHIDNFDISGVKTILNEFPQFIKKLEKIAHQI